MDAQCAVAVVVAAVDADSVVTGDVAVDVKNCVVDTIVKKAAEADLTCKNWPMGQVRGGFDQLEID